MNKLDPTALSALTSKNYQSGYNCAEAVLSAFNDALKLNLDVKVATAMGGGIGAAKNLCGALNGGVIVIGAIFGRNTPNEKVDKKIGSHIFMSRFLVSNYCKTPNYSSWRGVGPGIY